MKGKVMANERELFEKLCGGTLDVSRTLSGALFPPEEHALVTRLQRMAGKSSLSQDDRLTCVCAGRILRGLLALQGGEF